MRETKITCPICNGTGKITESRNLPKDLHSEKAKVAKSLRDAGYSIREIMKIMNYKSTNSITKLLDNGLINHDSRRQT